MSETVSDDQDNSEFNNPTFQKRLGEFAADCEKIENLLNDILKFQVPKMTVAGLLRISESEYSKYQHDKTAVPKIKGDRDAFAWARSLKVGLEWVQRWRTISAIGLNPANDDDRERRLLFTPWTAYATDADEAATFARVALDKLVRNNLSKDGSIIDRAKRPILFVSPINLINIEQILTGVTSRINQSFRKTYKISDIFEGFGSK